MRFQVFAFLCLIACVEELRAARIEIPLRLSLETLGEALNARVNLAYREGPCRYLKLEPQKIEAVGGRLRLAGPGRGALGVELAGNCQTAAAWQGAMQVTLVPRLDAAGRLRLRIIDSKLTGIPPLLWDAAKSQLHPRLERFGYDLGASREALAALLQSVAPPAHAAAMQQALEQLKVGEPRIEATHVVIPLALEIPDAWLAAPHVTAVSGAPLSEAEVEALERALEPWDAFLVYIVKHVALQGQDSALRKRLFTLLLESRYRLVELLSGDTPSTGDPLRALFLETWSELRAILADAKPRYTLFIDAADVLAALESAAPGLPLSAQGLRQLARSLRPGDTADPLAYAWERDPQLSQLFEVEELPEIEPAPAPPPVRSWLDFLITRAHAESALDPWVPSRDELATYSNRIGELLRKSSAGELRRTSVAAPYDRIYRHLVPTTALIESCWRQYVVRGGKVSYLRSQSGSVGIMQINQHVWRGFYDIQRVRWDTAYNIRAGAQILMRYLKDYAIPYAERTGEIDHVARAAYAVYNAGPRAVGRFAKSPPHPREARVDGKLWSLYRNIAAGAQIDLASCGVKQIKTVSR
jgi:soluble lytic murein transglycosylase-like protein